jgi:hypothetical protein
MSTPDVFGMADKLQENYRLKSLPEAARIGGAKGG